MRQGLFEVFGTGQLGLKADDLNRYSGMLAGVGLKVLKGIVIATGIFDQLTKQLNFAGKSEEIEKQLCPDFLLSINEKILDKMEVDKPYAIRSSALSERGGTGIYRSEFFWPTGNRIVDLINLWHCEAAVYASEFSREAELWRRKTNAAVGMAILIQPVVGFRFDENFLPALSGLAYVSLNGLPTIRVVAGLGTLAVRGGGMVYNLPFEKFHYFQKELWEEQEIVETITSGGKKGETSVRYGEIQAEISRGFKSFNGLFDVLERLRENGNFCLEWSISGNRTFVVQCATYEDHSPINLPFDPTDCFLLLEGSDVLYSGRATCKCIVYCRMWTNEVSRVLEHLNENLKDFILIVPQSASSEIADALLGDGSRLAFKHFSNALAVVEKQKSYSADEMLERAMMGMPTIDHTSGKGATHFAQLCSRANILFIGGEFDPKPLLRLPGGIEYRGHLGITMWKTLVEVVTDVAKKKGYVYVSKEPKISSYSLYQVQEWSDTLRSVANLLNDLDKPEIAGHFYNIHYAIAPNNDPIEFDPLRLDETIVAECGKTGIIKSLEVVLANGGYLEWIESHAWENGLKDYLEELLEHFKQQ